MTSGMTTAAHLDGTKVATVPILHARSLWEVSILNSPQRFQWVKMNLDTEAAVNTCPLHFGPDGARDGIFCRTAGGECIPDGGAWDFQGNDENGLSRFVNGRLTWSVHKMLCSQERFRAKDVKLSVWDPTVVSEFLCKAKMAGT